MSSQKELKVIVLCALKKNVLSSTGIIYKTRKENKQQQETAVNVLSSSDIFFEVATDHFFFSGKYNEKMKSN